MDCIHIILVVERIGTNDVNEMELASISANIYKGVHAFSLIPSSPRFIFWTQLLMYVSDVQSKA